MAVSSQSEPRGSEEHAFVRLNFRTKPWIKATIQRATALAGLDDSAFAKQVAHAEISTHERTELQGIDLSLSLLPWISMRQRPRP